MSNQVACDRQPARDYAVIEKAIEFIDAHRRVQPSLGSIAAAVNLSEFHLQRLFSRWVGISPKRFLQFLTKEHAKTQDCPAPEDCTTFSFTAKRSLPATTNPRARG
jgi:AraC family transcriptional regulator of adaptative response/methylated-DNA-[protein]-cysteine methyltransferase